ncbi:FxSxx-COOH system tetratricopeptide repeat protein [Saccharothrix sp.]|uniref:FxSxx-COOH system tetratricopeptide repeat protein n=1 Tax=Saccharothrix sp. TaxID=1873460 RepID=UPI002811D01D|nr:FxSxx-COOH system tetratricopeptide repeat protein [Saccharothrix sp.]
MSAPGNHRAAPEVLLQRFEAVDGAFARLSTRDLDYREVRDALWLACRIHPPHADPAAGPLAPPDVEPTEAAYPFQEPQAATEGLDEPDNSPEPDEAASAFDVEPPPEVPDPVPFEQWTPGPVTMTSTGEAGVVEHGARAAAAWPTMPAMPERRRIARALRPLSRRRPSRRDLVVDEEKTAVRAAQDGLWIPEWKGSPSQRFDVALVVDSAVTDDLWQQTAREFRAVLEQQGAFRDVRQATLDTGSPHVSALSLRSEGGVRQDWRHVVDPTGARLVVVLTDTIGKAWHSGAVGHALHHWAQKMPVVIVQTLNQSLWSWGGISTRRLQLSAPRPGAPNRQLRVAGAAVGPAVPVPVLALSAEWMSGWARLVSTPDTWVETTATLVVPSSEPVPVDDDAERLTARERVQRFRTYASSDSFHLAGLLAATPLSPPLMKLVQRVLLPDSDLTTLAEVVLGGLMRRVPASDPDSAAILYEFHNGVREELLATGRRLDTARVARVLADHAGEEFPVLRDLRAVLDDPAHAPVPGISAESLPLLRVQAAVLRALAGSYSRRGRELAEALAAHDVPRPDHDVTRVSGDDPTFAEDRDHQVITTDTQSNLGGSTGAPQGAAQGVEDVATGTHGTAVERRPTRQPQIWGPVPLRNPDFVGREELLEELRKRLGESGTTAVLPEALHGMGGVGKSQTVVEYIHRHASEYEVVWWIPSEQEAQIKASFVELAKRLGVATAGAADAAVPAVLEALRTFDPAKRWMLVFDNADSPQDVRDYFPAGAGHIVVTSRNSEWGRHARAVAVDLFTRAESIELLHRRGGDIDDVEADALAEALGDLPLAVEQAAAWRATTGMQVSEYLELLEQNRLELLNTGGSDDGQEPVVAAVWNVPLDRLRKDHLEALELLQVCAFFGPEPISQQLFRGVREAPVPEKLGLALRDPIKFGRAVRQISRYSLAKLDHRNNSLQLHRLVQTVLKNSLPPEEQEKMRHAVHVLLGHGDPGDPNSTANWPRYAELLPHALVSRAIDDTDEWVQSLVDNLVQYLLNTGDFGGARDLAADATKARAGSLGEAHPATLKMALLQGIALRRLGKTAEASELNERTRQLLVETMGEDHESMLEMLDSVAADRRSEGRFRDELELAETVYQQSKQLLGEEDPTTLRFAHNLGGSLRLMGDYQRAYEIDQENLRRRTAVLGVEHFHTQGSRNALCMDLRERGFYLEAAREQEQALQYQREVLGDNHTRVLGAQRNLAVSLRKAGQHRRAKDLAEECLEGYRRRNGDTDDGTIMSLMNLSTDLRHLGDLDGALDRARRAFRQFRSKDRRHPFTLVAALNLAVIHRLRGELEEALELDEKAHEILTDMFDRDHPWTLVAATNLASDYAAQHEWEKAKALDEDTFERSTRVLGPEHPSTLAVALNLAIDRAALDDQTGAAKLHGETVATFRRVLGDDHPATIAAAQYTRANCDTDTMQL